MNSYKYKLYTGPCIVDEIAAELEERGYQVTIGTENIYFDSGIPDALDLFDYLKFYGRFRWYDLQRITL